MSSTNDNRTEWAPLLATLATRQATAAAMGGAAKLDRYRASGRVDARQRIAALLDRATFVEIGSLAGNEKVPADAFVAGHGSIDGRAVLVGAEDFTVAGGSIGTAGATKRARIALLAQQERVPLIMMLEGAGHRATNALDAHRPAPNDLQAMSELAGLVPTVSIVTGPSAGHGALAAPMSDFVVMIQGQGALFTAGPPLVEASTGEKVDKQTLGGTQVHARNSGLAHCVAADADAALASTKRYLSYFPSNAWQSPPVCKDNPGKRLVEEILDLIPPNNRRPYDMRPVIAAMVDPGSMFELQPEYGPSIVTALCRLGGVPVAVVANNPLVMAGAITVAAAEKAARFIEITSAFHLPLVLLADNPGVLAGSASERAGILRSSARMFAAQHRCGVPKFHISIRKAFGFGSSVMGQNAFDDQTISLAFPGVTLGGIPADVGGRTAKESEETQQALRDNEAAGPWGLAGSATYDAIIDPREVRNRLLAGLRLANARVSQQMSPRMRTGYAL